MNFFNTDNNKENRSKELCDIYLLYFDETLGHIPLLIHPNDQDKNDEDIMRIITFHPIWFLNEKEQDSLNRIDLEYNKKMYFAKKFYIKSDRKKRRAGLEQSDIEKIVLIIVLPTDLDIFGGALLNKMTEIIKIEYQNTLFKIIESEIAKLEVLKTVKLKEIINNGNLERNKLKNTITIFCKEYFSSVIKQKDATTIKLQKAISFLLLKGIDISYITSDIEKNNFSNIRLFDPEKKTPNLLQSKENFKILNQTIDADFGEFEILVKNQSSKDLINVYIKITYVKDFFEKEILSEKVEKWLSQEELMFITPIVPGILNYLFLVTEEDQKKIKFSRKINLDKRSII